MSVIAVASCVNSTSSAAMLSGEDASTCRFVGVPERDSDDGEVVIYVNRNDYRYDT